MLFVREEESSSEQIALSDDKENILEHKTVKWTKEKRRKSQPKRENKTVGEKSYIFGCKYT